jgi:rhodanese-related sulfurtransferase
VSWLQRLLGGGQGIGPREAHDAVRAGALLLDVREPSEWQADHDPEARHGPLGELEGRLGGLPRHRRLVIFCGSGTARRGRLPAASGLDSRA